MKKRRVVISAQARRMLGEHIRFLAEVSVNAAIDKKEEIIKAIASLSEMPERYPFFSAPYIDSGKYRKMFIGSWYIVLYIVKDDAVYVDYILDCRKEYMWLGHGKANADTFEAFEEVRQMKADSTIGRAYSSTDEMMQDLLETE